MPVNINASNPEEMKQMASLNYHGEMPKLLWQRFKVQTVLSDEIWTSL